MRQKKLHPDLFLNVRHREASNLSVKAATRAAGRSVFLFFLIVPAARFSLQRLGRSRSTPTHPKPMILSLLTLIIFSLLGLSCVVAPFLMPAR